MRRIANCYIRLLLLTHITHPYHNGLHSTLSCRRSSEVKEAQVKVTTLPKIQPHNARGITAGGGAVASPGSGARGAQNYMKLFIPLNKVHVAAAELPQLLAQNTDVWRGNRVKLLSNFVHL